MDYNRLNGPQRGLLREALKTVIRDIETWDRVLDEGGFDRLSDIGSGTLDNRLYAYIAQYVGAGRMDDVVAHLRAAYENAPAFQSLDTELDFAADEVEARDVVRRQGGLERAVRGAGYADTFVWASELMGIGHRMCRVRSRNGAGVVLGTGMLVAPDIVLTAYHVVEHLIGTSGGRTDMTLTFGLAETGNGPGRQEAYRPAEDWDVLHAPYSNADLAVDAGMPNPGELDFALVRLERPASGDATPSGRRGVLDLERVGDPPGKDKLVLILQHPRGDNLKQAPGETMEPVTPLRLRYDADTDSGSSGGLVLDMALTPIALHHAGDPSSKIRAHYNQGIPLKLIRDAIKAAGVTLGRDDSLEGGGGGGDGTPPNAPELPPQPDLPGPGGAIRHPGWRRWIVPLAFGSALFSAVVGTVTVLYPCIFTGTCGEDDRVDYLLRFKEAGAPLADHMVRIQPASDESLKQTDRTNALGEVVFQVETERFYQGWVRLERTEQECQIDAFYPRSNRESEIEANRLEACQDLVPTSSGQSTPVTNGYSTAGEPGSGSVAFTALADDRRSVTVEEFATNRDPLDFARRVDGNATISVDSLVQAVPNPAARAGRAPLGLPDAPVVLDRTFYTVGFDPEIRLLRWAAFTIDARRTVSIRRGRDVWDFDPGIPREWQTGNDAYIRNTYDRGQMVRRSDSHFTTEPETALKVAREATYYTIGVPQADQTNRQTWRYVEDLGEHLSNELGPIPTIAGPIFQNPKENKGYFVIGPDRTLVPVELFRVHLRETSAGWRAIAFIVPNDGSIDREPENFLTSVEEVEARTGLTFFPDLSDQEAAALKAPTTLAEFSAD